LDSNTLAAPAALASCVIQDRQSLKKQASDNITCCFAERHSVHLQQSIATGG
jgi:hypothetical protein